MTSDLDQLDAILFDDDELDHETHMDHVAHIPHPRTIPHAQHRPVDTGPLGLYPVLTT